MSKPSKPPVNPGTVTNARSAGTGKFVTEQYAKTHPKTTTVEHNPRKK